MSITNSVEQFDLESPLYQINKQSTNMDEINELEEDQNSNDNIIFQKEIKNQRENSTNTAYCGIRGDSEITCILNIAVSAIGGGCFSFPHIIYEGGIIVSLICFLFITICVYYSIDLLRRFVVDTKYFSFALMTEKILGSNWLKVYAFCSFTIYTCMEVAYLSSIFVYVKGMYNLNGPLAHILYFLISMIIEILICLYITKIEYMHFLSIISIMCFVLMLLSLIVVAIVANATREVSNKFTSHNLFFPDLLEITFWNKLFKISSYLMVYLYGFSYHSTFPTLIGSLKNVNNSTTKKVHLISFGIITMIYLFISFFGYILSEEVPNEIFQEKDDLFSGGWATLRKPFKYSLIIFLLFVIPIRFIVLRDNYITLIGKSRLTVFKELPIVSVFIFICNILAFCVGEFEEHVQKYQIKTLILTFGGMFGVIISFCLPVINYVSVNGKKKIKSIIGYIISFIFVIIGFLSSGHTFYQIFIGDNKKDD